MPNLCINSGRAPSQKVLYSSLTGEVVAQREFLAKVGHEAQRPWHSKACHHYNMPKIVRQAHWIQPMGQSLQTLVAESGYRGQEIGQEVTTETSRVRRAEKKRRSRSSSLLQSVQTFSAAQTITCNRSCCPTRGCQISPSQGAVAASAEHIGRYRTSCLGGQSPVSLARN